MTSLKGKGRTCPVRRQEGGLGGGGSTHEGAAAAGGSCVCAELTGWGLLPSPPSGFAVTLSRSRRASLYFLSGMTVWGGSGVTAEVGPASGLPLSSRQILSSVGLTLPGSAGLGPWAGPEGHFHTASEIVLGSLGRGGGCMGSPLPFPPLCSLVRKNFF